MTNNFFTVHPIKAGRTQSEILQTLVVLLVQDCVVAANLWFEVTNLRIATIPTLEDERRLR